MFNLDNDKKWPYRMLIIGPSASGKTNALLNLIQQNNDNFIDKIYLYAKDLSKPKYSLLIKKREDAGIKHLNDPSALSEYSNTMDDVHNNIFFIKMVLTEQVKILDENIKANKAQYDLDRVTAMISALSSRE